MWCHSMKIAIICAMDEELSAIIHELRLSPVTTEYHKLPVLCATHNGHELYLILCGIGKVNAAVNTQKLISGTSLDYVINLGVAGNLDSELDFGDVVIATDLVHHDMDVTGFNIPLGQVPRMDIFAFPCSDTLLTLTNDILPKNYKIKRGRIASGDQFIDDAKRAQFIYQEFNAISCEMEGAAIAHTCYLNQIPFLVVRSLSDKAGNEERKAIHSYDELKNMAAMRASFVVKELLGRL